VAAKWRALAPPEFVFCIKAWQLITHAPSSPTYRRLRRAIKPHDRELLGYFRDTEAVWEAWKKTREIAQVLQASIVLFQCPASFQAKPENVENLSRFFRKVAAQPFRLAGEPRGAWPPEWFVGCALNMALIHCVDPFVQQALCGDTLYWRLHGQGSYSYRYTDQDLAQPRTSFLLRQNDRPAYILLNNISMKQDAARFMQLHFNRADPLLLPRANIV
jgi:uncharacterized protein YecE (DUF72 family)